MAGPRLARPFVVYLYYDGFAQFSRRFSQMKGPAANSGEKKS